MRERAKGEAAKAVVVRKSLGSKEVCRFKSGRPHHILFSCVQLTKTPVSVAIDC
jgi:hypothetical protein